MTNKNIFPLLVNLLLVVSIFSPLQAVEELRLLESDWYGIEWGNIEEEFDLEQFPVWMVDINCASFSVLASLPYMDEVTARNIVEERELSGAYRDHKDLFNRVELKLWQKRVISQIKFPTKSSQPAIRYRIRVNRRYGYYTDDDLDRYDGNPLGITQRLTASANDFTLNLLTDKDKFEQSYNDMTRGSLLYRKPAYSLIAGDFHLFALRGIVLGTRPNYSFDLTSLNSAQWSQPTISPATNTQQNRSLRGIASTVSFSNYQLLAFGSQTQLDAIVKDDRIDRLSDGGLHRTEGESLKRNNITETGYGGAFSYQYSLTDDVSVTLETAGILLNYSPPLEPSFDRRIPNPISGDRFGWLGWGGKIATPKLNTGFEIAQDLDGINAAKLDLAGSINVYNGIRYYLTLFNFPPEWNNPRGSSLDFGSEPQNRRGGAVSLTGKSDYWLVRRWRGGLELQSRPERTYTVPESSGSGKIDVEFETSDSRLGSFIFKFRHKIGVDPAGEDPPVQPFSEQKVKMVWTSDRFGDDRILLKAWTEAARLKSLTVSNNYSTRLGEEVFGGMVGGKVSLYGIAENDWLRQISCHIAGSYFATGRILPLYLGEGELPDRISSVRLSGKGMRWSSAIIWRNGASRWFGIKAARTKLFGTLDKPRDLEVSATMSVLF